MTKKRYKGLMRVWVHCWWKKYGEHTQENFTEGLMMKAFMKATPVWCDGMRSYAEAWENFSEARKDVGM